MLAYKMEYECICRPQFLIKGAKVQCIIPTYSAFQNFFFILVFPVPNSMRKKLLHTVLLLFCAICASAQTLKPLKSYLEDPAVSADAKDYYLGKFDLKAEDRAFTIADSMFTKNDATRPFYIYLTTKMITQAEGALRAELNVLSRHFLEQYPDGLLDFLYSKNNAVRSSFQNIWAHRVAVEVRITCDKDLYDCFNNSRKRALKNSREENHQRIEIFYNYLRKELNLFRHK